MSSPFSRRIVEFGARNPLLVDVGVGIALVTIVLVLGRIGAWP